VSAILSGHRCRAAWRGPAVISVAALSELLASFFSGSFKFGAGFLDRFVARQRPTTCTARLYEPQALVCRPVFGEVDQSFERALNFQLPASVEVELDGFTPFVARSWHLNFPPILFLSPRQIPAERPVPHCMKILFNQGFRGAV